MNTKQLLADFYLKLLMLPQEQFRSNNQALYATVRDALAIELETNPANVQLIFERMAEEDAKI